MASSVTAQDDNIFEKLRKADHKELEARQRAIENRLRATYRQNQERLSELIDLNSTLATTVSSVTVIGAPNTRHGFLQRLIDPLLSANRDRPYTQSEVVREAVNAANKLDKLGIFHSPVSVYFDRPSQVDPSTTPTDVAIIYKVAERSKLFAETGTDLGNAEGSAYAIVQWRNLFGGAETLGINASLGTRTRSAYQGSFETPIFSNPDFQFQLGGVQSSTQKLFASHEEVLKGIWTKFKYLSKSGAIHELGYNGAWRQVTGLSANASPSIRDDAGDSFKNSIAYTLTRDSRDNPSLPSTGTYTKTMTELAGVGPLGGDVAFLKTEVETQKAVPIPIPGVRGDSGVSLSAGMRAGLLYPLELSSGGGPVLSRINDRFQLGGPTDVRGFRLSGLGPRDGPDALGGDVYAAGSANLFLPLPRVGPEKPFRIQAFINGGRLLALHSREKEGSLSKEQIQESMVDAIKELGNGLPSMSAGVGLVYAHPAARVELNFSLPLVIRKAEEGRKGLQFGIGINFL